MHTLFKKWTDKNGKKGCAFEKIKKYIKLGIHDIFVSLKD